MDNIEGKIKKIKTVYTTKLPYKFSMLGIKELTYPFKSAIVGTFHGNEQLVPIMYVCQFTCCLRISLRRKTLSMEGSLYTCLLLCLVFKCICMKILKGNAWYLY